MDQKSPFKAMRNGLSSVIILFMCSFVADDTLSDVPVAILVERTSV